MFSASAGAKVHLFSVDELRLLTRLQAGECTPAERFGVVRDRPDCNCFGGFFGFGLRFHLNGDIVAT